MSANETINTSSTGAQKAGNLERFDLIPVEALRELAEHYGRGSLKYDDHNWRKGYDWSLSYAALQRHATAFWNGEDIDAETGSKHIIAVAWHAFTLATYMDNKRGFDDRYRLPEPLESPSLEGVIDAIKAPSRPTVNEALELHGNYRPDPLPPHDNGYWWNESAHLVYRYRGRWEFRSAHGNWVGSEYGDGPINTGGRFVGLGHVEPAGGPDW